MQEGAPNQPNQPNRPDQPQNGPEPDHVTEPGQEPTAEPMPGGPGPDAAPGGGPNLKLIIGSIVGLVLLAGAAVAAYALVGLGGNTPAEAPESVPIIETSPSPSASAGLEPDEQVTTLSPIKGSADEASGEAARSTVGGRFVLAVSVSLPDPSEGSFYEVFLGQPDSKTQFSAGKLYKVGDRWVMTLDQARDASIYSEVLVTSEKEDDGQPEESILTGEF
ncbi:MAG: hypothetical protein Q8Q11_04240 [bacterium]|nr:hypothetical protein [bacterium]MDZ4248050.1 hypothetical protein [Patescibacteria group bacterium]